MSSLIHSCSVRSRFIELTSPPLEWLEAQTLFPKVYWRAKDGCEIAAVGALFTFDEIPALEEGDERIVFGGCEFGKGRRQNAEGRSEEKEEERREKIGHGQGKREGSVWQEFPRKLFFQPRAVLKEGRLTVFSRDESEEFEPSLLVKKRERSTGPRLLHREEVPNFEVWKENLLRCLKEQELEKLVLARQVSLQFEEELDPFWVLRRLRENARNATLFAMQLSPERTFLGATPETFYQREGRTLNTHALAGTRRRGATVQEDERLKKELLASEKEKREFQYVQKFLSKELSSLCETLQEHPVEIAQNATLQHLVSRFTGKLKTSVSDQEIFRALHPTPAVGGTPRQKALTLISELETFDRGWYASPLGWMSRERAEFVVAIRSALIAKKQMHLFSGTGIVEGSNPEEEWAELEAKIKLFTSMFDSNKNKL